jgi:hypothetical protein
MNSSYTCDCKNSEIRWIDENHPHVAEKRTGWFCLGCLLQFAPLSPQKNTVEIDVVELFNIYKILDSLDSSHSDDCKDTVDFSGRISQDWFYHVKWKLEIILKSFDNIQFSQHKKTHEPTALPENRKPERHHS